MINMVKALMNWKNFTEVIKQNRVFDNPFLKKHKNSYKSILRYDKHLFTYFARSVLMIKST